MIATNLDFLMTREGINPTILSERTGIPQPTVHRIASGESKDPRTSTVKPLAEYFGFTVADLKERDLVAESTGVLEKKIPQHKAITPQEQALLELFREVTDEQKASVVRTLEAQKQDNERLWKELSKVMKMRK